MRPHCDRPVPESRNGASNTSLCMEHTETQGWRAAHTTMSLARSPRTTKTPSACGAPHRAVTHVSAGQRMYM